jgi:hypothetical protein
LANHIIFTFYAFHGLASDSPWAPWWRTQHQMAKYNNKDVVYDLGGGDGEAFAGRKIGASG